MAHVQHDGIYTTLENDATHRDKIENVLRTHSEGMWSGSVGTITAFYTGSTQESNTGKYYYDVHSIDNENADVEFAVTYGHRLGSGSEAGNVVGLTNPTKGIYSQFRQILLPPGTTQFNFHGDSGTDYKSEDFYAVVVNRSRFREKMDPGNWELVLTSGSNNVTLIDDSGASQNATIAASQREFWVVSGSIANGIHTTATSTATTTTSGSYGTFYPETGMILLNPSLLGDSDLTNSNDQIKVIENTGTSTATNDYNHKKLFNSIVSGVRFAARREEQKRSSYYFCRVKNNQYNHSQNPSYFSGTSAELTNKGFIQDPKSYITTIGLYNDNNELLAVSKLSQPLLKDMNTEALFKVKLEY